MSSLFHHNANKQTMNFEKNYFFQNSTANTNLCNIANGCSGTTNDRRIGSQVATTTSVAIANIHNITIAS
jgi:hypothetical protein